MYKRFTFCLNLVLSMKISFSIELSCVLSHGRAIRPKIL